MSKLRQPKGGFGFINFNYDVLLDLALAHLFSIYFGSLNDYFSVNYLKPHGSVNWYLYPRQEDSTLDAAWRDNMDSIMTVASNEMFRRETAIPFDNMNILDPRAIGGDGPPEFAANIDQVFNRMRQRKMKGEKRYFYPLLFIPLTTKLYGLVQGFSDLIVSRGKTMLSGSSDIYMIGYRGADDIIKEMMSDIQPGTKLHVVGASVDSAEEIMGRMLLAQPNLVHGDIFGKGFEPFAEAYS
jgi:hypothetical protein